MAHPLQKYEKWTKEQKATEIKKLDDEMEFIHRLGSSIRKSKVMDQLLKNQLIKEMDDRAKDIYYERKLLTGRF